MKIELTLGNDDFNTISSYSEDSFTVNEHVYSTGIIISAKELIAPWPVNTFDQIVLAHIEQIIALDPEIIIIGSGIGIKFLPEEYSAIALAKDIGIEYMDSGGACRCYNLLLDEGRKVVAGLLLPGAD